MLATLPSTSKLGNKLNGSELGNFHDSSNSGFMQGLHGSTRDRVANFSGMHRDRVL